MDPYNQPFAAEAAWYYAGTREPFVPVAPQQLLSQHPQQPWSSAGPRSHIQTEFDASTAAYDVADPTTSFAVSEGSYGPDRGVPLGTGSESSSPSHYIGYNQEPRRIRIKRIRTACEECRKRKQRCDGSESCAACEEQGTICRYRDVPPAKKDPTVDKILELAKEQNKHLETLTQGVHSLQSSLRGIEARLAKRK